MKGRQRWQLLGPVTASQRAGGRPRKAPEVPLGPGVAQPGRSPDTAHNLRSPRLGPSVSQISWDNRDTHSARLLRTYGVRCLWGPLTWRLCVPWDCGWGATYPVAHAASEALGAGQAGISHAALPALQTRTQRVSTHREPSGDPSPARLAHLGSLGANLTHLVTADTRGSGGALRAQSPLKDRQTV